MKTYTPPQGLEREKILLWLCDGCEEFPCMIELDGQLTVLHSQNEFDSFLDRMQNELVK